VAGAGVYLLAIAPGQAQEGSAPTNGLDPANVRCSTDAYVEAVQFRLLRIDPARYLELDIDSPLFRNRLAYRCFGVESRERGAIDPWRVDAPRYGLVDELRATSLGERDVPLALVCWTGGGVRFIDAWAVRRRLLEPDALTGLALARDPLRPGELTSFAFLARRRRMVEAHAMCAQFQQHLGDLLATQPSASTLVAAQHLRWLPPFGVVPLERPPLPGFLEASFFTGVARRGAPGSGQETEFIDARLLGTLQEQALGHAPIDLEAREFVRVYRAWQNVRAVEGGEAVQPMVVFASGLLPELAIARADMARWDFSNYASCCDGS
jgi:hypothetical protein